MEIIIYFLKLFGFIAESNSSTINKADKIILLSKRLTNTFFLLMTKKKLEYVTNGISTKIKKGLIKTTKVIDVLFLSNLIESKDNRFIRCSNNVE